MKDIVKLILDLGDISKDYMILIDSELNVVWVNHKLEKKGFDNKKIRGKPLKKIFKGKTEYCTLTDVKEALDKKKIITKKRKNYEIATIPITVSGNTFVLVISAEKNVDELDDLFETQFHSTLNAFSDPVHIIDEDYNIILFNDAFKEFNKKHGITTDVFGKNLFKIFPMLSKKVKKEYDKVFKTGEVLTTEEKTEIKDKKVYTSTRKIPIFEEDNVVRIITIVRDISQEKEAELKYRSIFENTGAASGIFGEDNIIKSCNSAFEELSGYKKDEIIGKMHWYDFVPKEDLKRMKKYHKQRSAHKGHPPSQYECKFIDKKGNEKRVQVNIALVPGSDQRVVSLIDITDIKKAEEKLKESQEKYKSLFDNMLEVVYTLDTKGRLTSVNKTVEKMFGYKPENIIGKRFKNWIPPGEMPKALKIFKAVVQGKNIDEETKIKGKNGKLHDVQVTSTPLRRSGKLVGTQGVIRDITEQKRTEEIQKKNEQILNDVGRMAKVGGWELDIKSKEVKWTDETYRIHEVPLGKKIKLNYAVSFFHPEDRPKLEKAIKNAIEKGQPYDMELKFITAKGNHLLTRTLGKPVKEKGKVVRLVGTFQDITERKKIEQDFERIFELSSNLICVADIKTKKFTKVNPAFTQTLGWSEKELLSKPFTEFIHPDDIKPTNDVVEKQLLKGKKVLTFQNRYRCKDGSYKWLDWNSHPITEEGKTYAIARDITERKKIQDKLKQSKKLLNQVISHSTDLYYMHDTNHIITYISPQCKNFFGYTEEEMKTKWTRTLTDNPLNKKGVKITEKAIKTGKSQEPYNLELQRKDGSKFLVEVNESPIKDKDGKVVAISGSLRDITAENKAKKILEENEKRYSLAFKSTGQLVYDYDIESGKIVWKGDIKSNTGYDEKEFNPDIDEWEKMIYKEDRKRAIDLLDEAMKQNKPYEIEYRFKQKDGSYKYVQDHGDFITDKKGKIYRMVGTMRDISFKKKAEKEREKLNKELEKRVKELERFQKLTVGRELRMIELKKKLKQLKNKEEEE